MASKSNTVQSPFVSKAEEQLPGLYSRADAETIRAGRDQRELEKREKQEAAKEAAAETVERHNPAQGINDVEKALKDAVEAGQTS